MTRRSGRTPDPEEQRKLFRRMHWTFVWAPPLLIIFVGGSTAALVAWLVPLAGTAFWERWLMAFMLITGVPALVYVVRERFRR